MGLYVPCQGTGRMRERILFAWEVSAQGSPKYFTSMSQRGRAMLPACLVSFKSTIPRAQFFLLLLRLQNFQLRTIKFCSVVFGVTLRLLVINILSFVSRHQRTLLLRQVLSGQDSVQAPAQKFFIPHLMHLTPPVMSVTKLRRSGGTMFTTPDGRSVDSTR